MLAVINAPFLHREDFMRPVIVVMMTALGTSAPVVVGQEATSPSTSSAYSSAFKGYRPFKAPTMATWREVNRVVGRVGGHAGSLQLDTQPPPASREAVEKTPANAPPAASSPAERQQR